MAEKIFIDGSCACRAEINPNSAVIIKFPGSHRSKKPESKSLSAKIRSGIENSDMVHSLLHESCKGTKIEGIPFWQSVVASASFTVVGALMLFLFI